MFRNLIPDLSEQYHVIAPDLPGFGFTDAPLCGRKSRGYTVAVVSGLTDMDAITLSSPFGGKWSQRSDHRLARDPDHSLVGVASVRPSIMIPFAAPRSRYSGRFERRVEARN
jgi:hypothetical protein